VPDAGTGAPEFEDVQTTLLAVAIAIILALVAALVGPLLIDWGTYRALIESEASRLVGLDVKVNGKIDARLLPSPQLTLHDIAIGKEVRAGALDIEFALGPLMQGEWRASELRIAAPQLRLGLDAQGRIEAPRPAIGFSPDALSIDKLSIVNGKVTLTDAASGGSVTLDKLYFNGEATSLTGPFHGEGDVVVAGSHYPYRINGGRLADAGTLKLRLNVDPRDHPVNFQADGALSFGADPRFKGEVSLARTAGIAAPGGGKADRAWRIRSKIDASPASALLEDAEFQFGPAEHGLKFTGVADFKFGKTPRFKGELTGRQIDLDRVLSGTDDGRSSPAAALRKLAELAGGAFRPPIPIEIGLGIDQVTLGGDTVQNVRGDLTAEDGGWNLASFEFRAPGFTQARLSGHLAVADSGVSFTGPAEVDSNDPRALAAWLEGRAAPAQSELKRLRLRGDVTLGSEKVAVTRLTAEFARKTVAGHFAYVFAADGHPSRLDAALNAPELDLDVALGFGKAMLAGSTLERPREMAIGLDIGRATIAGIEGRDISARVTVDADHWQIDKLSVADLGGAAFSASGRIALAGPSPQGSMRLDLDAPDLAPVTALLSQFAPRTARAFSARAPAMAPAKLHADLTIDGSGPAKLSIDGSLGRVRAALDGSGVFDPKAFRIGAVKLDGKLTADAGQALVEMLGLSSFVAVGSGPGALTVKAEGPAGGALRVDSHLTARGLDAGLDGTMNLFGGDAPTAALRARVARADAAPLRGAGRARPLPVTFAGRVTLSAEDFALRDVRASIAGSALHGRLAVTLATPHRLRGEIEAETAEVPALIAAAIGMPAPAKSQGTEWVWPEQPFGQGAFGDLAGSVALKVRQFALLPRLSAREFHATLQFGRNEWALDDMTGALSGGRLAGRLAFRSGADGVTAEGKLALTGLDAASLLRAAARPPVAGTLDLHIEAKGTGLSPVALVGSLHGGGKIVLEDAEFAGLDPRAFDAVSRAVDRGLPVEPDRIAGVVRRARDSGGLAVKHVEGALIVDAGQVRLSDVTADSRGAALTLGGNLDLIDGAFDARLVLSGTNKAGGVRPDIFMAWTGPVTAPSRSIDVSALSGWLTLRAIEKQAQRVHELEEAARKEREAETARREAERQRREAEQKRREAEQRQREEAERQRLAAEQARREAERKRLEDEERRRRQAVQTPPAGRVAPAAIDDPIFMPPAGLAPVTPPHMSPNVLPMPGRSPARPVQIQQAPPRPPQMERVPAQAGTAPALPAPIEILPAPKPLGGVPEASAGPQR
jgi:large subunit ribosomal protein L24